MIWLPIFEVLVIQDPTCFTSRALRFFWSLISHWPVSILVFFPCFLGALTNHCLCSARGKSAVSKALMISSSTSTCKYLSSLPLWDAPSLLLSLRMVCLVGSICARIATQQGPVSAVDIYKDCIPVSFQQNGIAASHFYPRNRNMNALHVIELTLLRPLGNRFLTFPKLIYIYKIHMQCRFLYMVAIVLLGKPVGTEYIHVWWSISQTLQYLSPLSLFHLLSWLFFHIRLKQMCHIASLWLYEQTLDMSKERKLHDFLSPVSFHGSQYRRHRKMSKHLVSVLNFFFLKKKKKK